MMCGKYMPFLSSFVGSFIRQRSPTKRLQNGMMYYGEFVSAVFQQFGCVSDNIITWKSTSKSNQKIVAALCTMCCVCRQEMRMRSLKYIHIYITHYHTQTPSYFVCILMDACTLYNKLSMLAFMRICMFYSLRLLRNTKHISVRCSQVDVQYTIHTAHTNTQHSEFV